MYFDDMYQRYKDIKEKLQDETSRILFDSRIEYMVTRNIDKLERDLFDESKIYRCFDMDKYLDDVNRK